MLNRTITLDPLNEGERKAAKTSKRFPASISSDTPITRRSYDGEWSEILEHSARAIDLSRAPLPLLESHNRMAVNIGIVDGLRVDGGKLRGEVVLGNSARAEELAADIAGGIVRSLSIGYEIIEQKRDEPKKRITATRWRPHEVSIVSTPADTTVGIGRSTMEEQNVTPPPQSPTRREEIAPTDAVLAERERIATIQKLVTRNHLGDDFAGDLVTRGVPLDQARGLSLERLVQRQEENPIDGHVRLDLGRSPITPGEDYAQDFRSAAIDSLLIRSGIAVPKPHAAAGDVSASVYDLARVCLSRAGKSATRFFGGEARGPDLLKRAMTTSDFANILVGTLGAAVRTGYELEPASHRPWVRVAPVADFRVQNRPILGSAPSLEAVAEGAEYHDGSLSDDKASYSVAKYGRVVSLSWEVLVNDNLGAFVRVQPALGQAARRLEAGLVYDLLASNSAAGPAMQDGTNLFDALHSNLVASAAFDATQLGKARALLRKQTALGGGYLSLVPRFLIVGPDKETAAEVLIANASRPAAGADKTVAAWVASLELVVEPRIATTNTYLAAAPAQIDTCELGLLEENMGGPVIEEEEEFRKDVKRWKVRHVAGAKYLDWRGLVRMIVT
jgi:HK97 family phage prohead protease